MKAITFLTLVGIGAGAIYLLDQKKGPKRRAQLQKNLENTTRSADDPHLFDEMATSLVLLPRTVRGEHGL